MAMKVSLTKTIVLPGLEFLWKQTLGDSRICIAVLDGPVDQSHPCFDGAQLTQIKTVISGGADTGPASQHGTHVASVIFGQHGSPVHGIAPGCRGLIVPVFTDGNNGDLAPCSQIDLARAIQQAVEAGANVINISGGQLTPSGMADPLLANAVRYCADNNVLIVAAAGNDGCECLHVPAAIAPVLAVGAMDARGNPIDFSNWGQIYQTLGILAPGESILGAVAGGGTGTKTGTSFAAPIISGLAALLLSIQLKQGREPDPYKIRNAILKSAQPCPLEEDAKCRRFLAGSVDVNGAYTLVVQGDVQMSDLQLEDTAVQPSEIDSTDLQVPVYSAESNLSEASNIINSDRESATQKLAVGVEASEVVPASLVPAHLEVLEKSEASSVAPSECATCADKSKKPQLVYALGELGTDFGSQARRDAFTQAIPPNTTLLQYLNDNPWEAQSLIWTLNLDATPIYAIVPVGPFANITYDRLRQFLGDESIERVSIPGYVGGSVTLLSGQTVPAIVPELRGIYSWSVEALIDTLVATFDSATRENTSPKIREYLNRIYYEYRNLGMTPQERALNFSATNAFQITEVMESAGVSQLGLDRITVEKSPICRPDSDCYDVKLQFFNLENNQRAGKVYRFTLDVSDVIPVTIGSVRSWSIAS
ncbi:MAG: PatA/PatG family cyanobactin maturation protease [Cyanobacteria bacterium SBLK]|nr:PatA/PatG family cyanobactin maturation protease [Cyanobacteria bacterium SBLK]